MAGRSIEGLVGGAVLVQPCLAGDFAVWADTGKHFVCDDRGGELVATGIEYGDFVAGPLRVVEPFRGRVERRSAVTRITAGGSLGHPGGAEVNHHQPIRLAG